ncbi:MAG TPA: alpha/beta hydrolase [Acidimicrobiia bacterium]|jgi:pimeloyl-ACP methyl ester carboxylesterase
MEQVVETRPRVRLEQRTLEVDGFEVGVAMAGHGAPLVLLHGFGVESMLYAQTLARLTHLGFRVIAIDVPGHGRSDGVGPLPSLSDYVHRIDGALRALRTEHIGPCVVVGHSLGGRLALELAAADPARVLGLVLLAPITGAPWDRLQGLLRWSPPVLAGYGVLAALDVAATVPLRTDRAQSLKLSRRIVPSVQTMVLRPWNAFATMTAILRAPASTAALDTVRAAHVPAVVVHGEHDRLVPVGAARSTARRLDAAFVSIPEVGHNWMIRDPDALPTVLGTAVNGPFGAALALRGYDVRSR